MNWSLTPRELLTDETETDCRHQLWLSICQKAANDQALRRYLDQATRGLTGGEAEQATIEAWLDWQGQEATRRRIDRLAGELW